MTKIRLGFRSRLAPVAGPFAKGRLVWQPARRTQADGDVILRDGFTVYLDTAQRVEVDVPPGVYRVTEYLEQTVQTWLLVPDTSDVVSYVELVEVEESTLDPAGPPPLDVWRAALDDAVHEATEHAEAYASAARGHELAAGGSAISAGNSRDLAAGSATAADTAATLAVGRATAAGNSAAAAAGSAGAAAGSATTAGSAATAAGTAAGTATAAAGQAQSSAESAATSAEGARVRRDQAQTAAQRAETALAGIRQVTVVQVPAAQWPPPADSDPLNFYVRVP